MLQKAWPLYRIDADKLKTLRPDVVITQAQCEVCAVSLAEVEAALSQWPGARPRVLSLSPRALADVWEDIRRVAEVLEAQERGQELLKSLKSRVVDIIEKACVVKRPPSVACIEWLDPLMSAGNWVPELVELAGGLNLFGEAGKHSPWMNWEAILEHDPEIVVLLPCGLDIQRIRLEIPGLTRKPDWAGLRAVRSRRVYLVDGSQYFNRPGPRLVESLEILAEIFHPKIFHFGHQNSGWVRL